MNYKSKIKNKNINNYMKELMMNSLRDGTNNFRFKKILRKNRLKT